MLGTLLLASALLVQQDTTKTRISSDTTNTPPDTTQVVDTTGWLMTDSLAITDTSLVITPGESFINEMWDYLITGTGSPPVQPPDTTPPIDPTIPPAGPIVVQGPGCVDMADSVSYLCTLQFQPDAQVDSTYWRRNDGQGSTFFYGDSLQWGYVAFPCTQSSGSMDSRSYRNDLRSALISVPVAHSCSGGTTPPPIITPPPGGAVVWDFNDPNNLGLQKPLPNMNKQFWDATGGVNNDGAVRVDYWTGMPIGWTQLNLDEQPASHHWTLTMWVRIVDSDGAPHTMEHEGSSIKIVRTCNTPTCPGTGNNPPGRIGTWEYHLRQNPEPVCRFIPDHWSPAGTQTKYCTGTLPTDGQWHVWELEFDARDLQAIKQILRIDGVESGRMQYRNQDPQGRDLTGPLNISPFVDMYSCGGDTNACRQTVNTGSVYFDDFAFVSLAP